MLLCRYCFCNQQAECFVLNSETVLCIGRIISKYRQLQGLLFFEIFLVYKILYFCYNDNAHRKY
jgi:hypothetical protein